MDQQTLDAYQRKAAVFAADWHAQSAPTDLQKIVQRFFAPGPTADIGCGSGRDTAWLCRHGFPATGYDASEGLLTEARRLYPDICFRRSALPRLDGIADEAFVNVLCETVIMHLAPDVIPDAVRRLVAVLRPEGILYLSWRVAQAGSNRDEHGRLYSHFHPDLVRGALDHAKILMDEEVRSASSGKIIHRIVARKFAVADGSR